MTNRVNQLLSLLVVIVALTLFSNSSTAEASTLKPTLVEGNIEAVEAGEIEGIIKEASGTVKLVTSYKQMTETNLVTGKITKKYYDYKYASYPSGYTYKAKEKWTELGTFWQKLHGTNIWQINVSYSRSY